jgi:hypothetical protein
MWSFFVVGGDLVRGVDECADVVGDGVVRVSFEAGCQHVPASVSGRND